MNIASESKITQLSEIKYNFNLNVFEGPLDVLLHLAKTNQVEITDISLDSLIDQYISYIESVQDEGINVASEYIEMAAELIRLKSKTLLPSSGKDELEEMLSDGSYTREELIRKLVTYKKYKDISLKLEILHENRPQNMYKEQSMMDELRDMNFIDSITMNKLKQAMQSVFLKQSELDESVRTIEVKELDVESKVKEFKKLEQSISFDRLIQKCTKIEKVSYFLALLEAMKLQYVKIETEQSKFLIVPKGAVDGN